MPVGCGGAGIRSAAALEVAVTIDDPTFYTAPWTVTIRQPLILDSELLDYYCLENERSWQHMVKKP